MLCVDAGQTFALPHGIERRDVFVTAEVPTVYELFQNYPNPFNPETRIRYALPERASVHMTVYDVTGKEVATVVQGEQAGGMHEVRFSGTHLPSGVYVCRLTATGETGGRFSEMRKMVLLK